MNQKSIVISNLVLFRALFGIGQSEVLFAQQFDMPQLRPDDENAIDRSNPEDLTLEQHFSSYHYNDIGFNDIFDEHGIKVYTASELKRLLNKEIPLEYVESFKNLRTSTNTPLFDARDIVKFYENNINEKDLKKSIKKIGENELNRSTLIKKLYKREHKLWSSAMKKQNYIFNNPENFKTLYSLSLVKRSLEYFKDTGKPNMLITYPALDMKKAFFSPAAREMIKTLSESYDIWFATVKDEKDLYKAIRKAPKLDLLILSGHGSLESIQLNTPTSGFEELSYIDINDKELKKHLKNLRKDATIFLNSCSTGMGQDSEDNLANQISKMAPGRNVIAATAPFAIHELVIEQTYPLLVTIPEKTYITRK